MAKLSQLETNAARKILLWSFFGLLVVFALLLVHDNDISGLLVLGSLAVLIVVSLVCIASRRGHLRWLFLVPLAVYVGFFWCMCFHFFDLRTRVRWMFEAHSYKRDVLAQASSFPFLGLQHAEWDGWGFAGNDTTAYVVFDPKDRLRESSRRKVSDDLPGVPCKVWKVQRMEAHWYVVLLYTDEEWNSC